MLLTACAQDADRVPQELLSDVCTDCGFDTFFSLQQFQLSPEEFQTVFREASGYFRHCSDLFDIYHNYQGMNNLKTVNDTSGHNAGDELIRGACRIVCETFKHSPVFRVGGDEFAVISQKSDYDEIDELVQMIEVHNKKALRDGGIVIACGMSKYDNDSSVASVFERADQNMYVNKSDLKAGKNG